MRKLLVIFALALALTVLFAVGCSDRGTNSNGEVEISEGGRLLAINAFYDELMLQIRNEFQLVELAAYQPRVSYSSIYGGSDQPVPLLILLPPQGADQYFYFNHGLQELADELIAKGEIQPMAIVSINNDPVFSGYFYASCNPQGPPTDRDVVRNPAAGDYDAIVGRSLVDFIYNGYCTFAINEPAKRGIGGVGMGAYGAFRAAMLNPGVFTSVSGICGPMDFDGADGNGGFIDYFDDCIAEQVAHVNSTDPEYVFTLDDFDTCYANPLTQMLCGGSMAFSPHDTLVNVTVEPRVGNPPTVTIDTRDVITDSTTLIDHIVLADDHYFHFHLPFDADGNVHSPIWTNCWVPNNLESIFGNNPAALDGVDIWLASSPEARFGFHEQTTSWISTLQNAGHAVSTATYSGYTGNPAVDHEYIYDMMKEMLIFHSQSFGD